MKLHLFTSNYPYGFGESFINNELPYLKKEFGDISVYPMSNTGELQPSFDSTVPIIFDLGKEGAPVTLGDKIYMAKVLFKEWRHCRKKGFFIKKLRRFYAMLKQAVKMAKWLRSQELDHKDIFYSFWMNQWGLALAVFRHRWNGPDFVFRVNGVDIHDERHEGDYLPFRHFVYTQTNRVIPLSKTARDYIRDLNVFPEKIHHAYFGTKDMGPAPDIQKEKYTIFSCSTIIPLKRIPKIARSIALLDFPVKWVHHGDGPELELVQSIMNDTPDHIEFVNTQRLPDYYKVLEMERDLCPDLFMNLSTSEGLPVAVMEAMSFGTPALLNDVGSCKEFITEQTGALVSEDASPEEIAREIKKLKESGISSSGRDIVRNFWFENFSAERNYSYFAQQLKNRFESA